MSSRYSRILLQAGLFLRPFVTEDGRRGQLADASSLQFLVEEMLAHSAVEIGILSSSVLGDAASTLPTALKKRVKVLDKDGVVRAKCDAVFRHIADELKLDLGGHGVAIGGYQPTQLQADAASLYLEFYPYLLALEHEMEIAIDVPAWAELADAIRLQLKSPDARAVLSSISGIARTYSRTSVDAPVIRPSAHPQLVEQFEQLLEDEAYRELSEQNKFFGIPAKAQYARTHVARTLRALLSKPAAAQLLESGSRAISTASHIPIPGKDALSRLFARDYLPPLVSYRDLVASAERSWRAARPEFVPLPGYEYRVSPGWD